MTVMINESDAHVGKTFCEFGRSGNGGILMVYMDRLCTEFGGGKKSEKDGGNNIDRGV